tara:strand:- start:653 stop:1012 length:360 start_codon:yes stop_codon:yes gene_type:complete
MFGGSGMKLSEKRMLEIIDNKQIGECSKEERDQVMAFAFGSEFMESENKGDIEHYDKDLKSDDIYALLSEHFNYKIEFRSMSKKELKTFIKDLLDGKSEYFLNDDFPKEVLITFLKEQG